MEFNKIKPVHIVIAAFFFKWIAFGLSYQDCMGALVLFTGLFIHHALEYHYPKRPDVRHALEIVHKQLLEVQQKTDDLEHDVTALKFGSVKR